jgi:hypothetical protein
VILAAALPPTPGDVVIGILAVLAGALVTSVSVFLARRSSNWLHYMTAAGGLLVVAGIVGQRTATDGTPTGPWNAGISVPLLGVRLDMVAAIGIIVCLVGITLTLLFERVSVDGGERPRPLVHRPLEDDDAV